jgi:phenylalanyl-tRNA synthetase beta chain
VVVRDPRAEGGGATRHRAAGLVARDTAGFSDAASLVDYVLRAFGAMGVREPAELPGTIPGRSARVRVAGETVAELGEIRPEVLVALRVPVPVAWAEVDLDALWPLVRRSEDLL